MRDISVAPSLRSSLLAALRHRLESLPPGSAEPIRSRASDDDAEEALRRVSVPLRARLLKCTLQADEPAQILEALAVVASRADLDDLRYLDAFNVCFESWNGDYLPQEKQRFLALYRAVLRRALGEP